jgi:outer membrane lipoprotein-sorting protein
LKATDETAFIREMWLWADPRSAYVKRALYKDINLNETTFDFKTIDFKIKPGRNDFRYEPPPGVEVVRLPGSD